MSKKPSAEHTACCAKNSDRPLRPCGLWTAVPPRVVLYVAVLVFITWATSRGWPVSAALSTAGAAAAVVIALIRGEVPVLPSAPSPPRAGF